MSQEKTIFQKIIDRDIPVDLIYEDPWCVAFHDINPQAPIHCLIVPRKLIPRVGESEDGDAATLGHLLLASREVARKLDVLDRDKGYRIVINHGKDAGETVPHLHVHLLAGRPLQWPPG
jgi:histidine triad (HIT) family protein